MISPETKRSPDAKKKESNSTFMLFGRPLSCSERATYNMYWFIDTFCMSLSLPLSITQKLSKILFPGFSFSVCIELTYKCLLKHDLNLLVNVNFSLRSANHFKVAVKLFHYWNFTFLNMFTQTCFGIKCHGTIACDYHSYSIFYFWSALQTLTN